MKRLISLLRTLFCSHDWHGTIEGSGGTHERLCQKCGQMQHNFNPDRAWGRWESGPHMNWDVLRSPLSEVERRFVKERNAQWARAEAMRETRYALDKARHRRSMAS